ncbi:MAG: metallophosphoesterase, partial [Phycisphaerales bacterium]|nr:metallophosphoesterase [Phycisphaerales bacterium]
MARIALIADVHANLQALEAVLEDLRMTGYDQLACLGDVVGY